MENKKMSTEEAKEMVKEFVDGVKLVLAVASMDCPGRRRIAHVACVIV